MHSETLLSLFLPVLPTLLRSYPTGQAERKAARKMLPHLSHLNARKYQMFIKSWTTNKSEDKIESAQSAA
jgi:hypothetical protein